MRKNGPLSLLFHCLVIVFMLAPLVIVCLVAFTPEPTLSLPTTHWSLRWFETLLEHDEFISSFWLSLGLAAGSATLSCLLSIPAGIALVRYDFPGKNAISGLLFSPLLIPHLVLGVALMRMFTLMGVNGSLFWLLVAHIVVVTPYVLRLILTALVGFDRSTEQAAQSLGASNLMVFFKITLPIITPGIAGGWALAFINSFDEVTMSVFVTSPSTITLPVRMYMYTTESIDPMIAAVSTVMILITAILMFVIDRFYGLDRLLIGKN